jgi:uncharacterized repeat protein (TIGR01451 family)
MKTKIWYALLKRMRLGRAVLFAVAVALSTIAPASAMNLDLTPSHNSSDSRRGSPTANAVGPTLSISMSVVSPQPVLSGNPVTWEISWECSSVEATPCTGARIDVTKPTLTGNGSAAGSPGFTTSAVADGTGAHYVFIDPLPAGSSGTLQLLWESVNLHTPDGTVLTPVATFSATNASGVQSSAGAEIESATHLAITKRRLPTSEPPLNVEVTYEINVFDSSWPNFSNPLPGTWTVVNAVVTDTLPPGSVFVSATGGGTYDAATHMVIWPAIPEAAAYEYFGFKFYITIRYPSPTFSADNDPANPSDHVTNSATVVGKPFGLPTGSDVTSQSSATHGFLNEPIVNGNFFKTDGHNSGVRGGSEIAPFKLLWDNTNSSVPATFTGIDRLPCPVTTPTGPLTPCANPGFRLTRFIVEGSVTSGIVAVNYTTNLGNTGTISFNAGSVFKSPGVDDDVPRSFGPGEFVSHFTVTGTVAGGFHFLLTLYGTIAPDFPDDLATEIDVMTNCAEGSLDFGSFGDVQGPFNSCNPLDIVPARPGIYHGKGGISLGAIAPTETRTFSLDANSCAGDLPWRPVVTDLLPANLQYIPGTQTANSIAGVPATFESIDNYQGTGRQLLRWSWPGGQAINPCIGGFGATFQARVVPGTPPGTYTNYGQFFDAVFTNNNTPLTNICVYALEPDTGDFDGDGNTAEFRCISPANYTVVETASMVVTKEVRGSFDASFKTAPDIGLVNPGDPAEYRLTLQNTGNLNLTNLVAYDILPFVGDTGVSGTQLGTPRGSQWQPVLAGAVTPPPGGTVEYSASANPCRGEVITQGGALASGPAGCMNDWTTSPSSFSAVRALRINLGATLLTGGESRTVIVPMNAPLGVEGIAWNTVALAGQPADTSTWLLPTEPPKVGLAVPIDLELDKTVSPATSVSPGAALTYNVTVTNRGPGSATGVTVTDVLPAGLTLQSAAPSVGSYDSATGLWTVGSLALNGSAMLTITATVNAGTEGTTITNYAQVSAANELELDSTPNNNPGPVPSEDDEDAVTTPVVNTASPSLSTIPDPSSGTVGETLNDSATLSGGFNPTGDITFNLYPPSDPTCSGTPAFTDVVSVNGNGTYLTSSGFASSVVGVWRWTATYSGDGNNNGVSSGCNAEQVTISQPIQSQLTPTATTCSQFYSGTAATLSQLEYAIKSGKLNSVAPGVFFYWVKVTAVAGSNNFAINQTITSSNNNFSHFFSQASGTAVYMSNCVKINNANISTSNGVTTVSFNASSAGTYIIGIKYDSTSVKGFNAPSPNTTVHYTFTLMGSPSSTQGLDLKKKP